MIHLRRIIDSFGKKLYRNKDAVDRFCDYTSGVFICTSPLSIYFLTKDKIKAKKYVLVGDPSVAQNVKKYLGKKLREPVIAKLYYALRGMDIEIIENESQYMTLQEEVKEFELLFCASKDTDYTKMTAYLPEKLNQLSPKIKSKAIVMVKSAEEDLSLDSIHRLEQFTHVKAFFHNTKLRVVTESTTDLHIKMSMDESTKSAMLFSAATIALSIARRGTKR